MSLTYFETEDAIVTISDAAQAKYEAEQRDMSREQQRAEILNFAAAGSVVSIAALIIKHIVGG